MKKYCRASQSWEWSSLILKTVSGIYLNIVFVKKGEMTDGND